MYRAFHTIDYSFEIKHINFYQFSLTNKSYIYVIYLTILKVNLLALRAVEKK